MIPKGTLSVYSFYSDGAKVVVARMKRGPLCPKSTCINGIAALGGASNQQLRQRFRLYMKPAFSTPDVRPDVHSAPIRHGAHCGWVGSATIPRWIPKRQVVLPDIGAQQRRCVCAPLSALHGVNLSSVQGYGLLVTPSLCALGARPFASLSAPWASAWYIFSGV